MNPPPPHQPYPPQQPGRPGPGGQHSGGYPHPQANGQQWPPVPPAPVRRRRRAWPWIVSGLVVFLLLIMMAGAAGSKNRGTNASGSGTQTNAQPAGVQAAGPAKAISARDWAKIAKEPDSHVGESIIVYGEVTQFDSATGSDTFRANVDGVVHQVTYGFSGYETNTVLTGDGVDLGNLVEGDLFEADAVVEDSVSYNNTMGGSLTAPKLAVTKIKMLGSTKQ